MSISPDLPPKNKDKRRLIAGILIIGVATVLGSFFLDLNNSFKEILSTFADLKNWQDLYKFIWVLIWCFIGLGCAAISASHNTKPDGIKFYKIYAAYFLLILLISSIVFIFFSAFKDSSRVLFYFATTPISFFLGYKIDYVGNFILSLITSWL